MSIEEKLKSLSASLSPESFKVVKEYAENRTYEGKHRIVHSVDTYLGLLGTPIKNNDTAELTKSFVLIRSHLCQNHPKAVVSGKLSELYNLTNALVEKGLITGDIIFPDKPNSDSTHEVYKNQIIP
ncbi:MAG: hypothetical protein JAY74_11435 [Candidatus Thiodiazotropha taylori]|nr:hypothetical protein [Candidatus Thiodiazotropha taylori]